MKFKRERDIGNQIYMRWSVRRRVEAREKQSFACFERGRILQQDRYGRNSINRSLNVRISCVISIVQNSVNIQNTTWIGKRMLEQCTYDNTKSL